LIAAAVLVLGFGIGLYAEDRVGSKEPTSAAPAPPPPPPPPAPTQTTAPSESATAGPELEVGGEHRPVFAVAALPPAARTQLKARGAWRRGCPVPLSGLRLLTVTYRGFDRQTHTGELVVNAGAAHPLKRVFRRLYRQRFPIRHIGFDYSYGRRGDRPPDGDVTASFSCRQSVPSPCTGGTKSGHWSNHAYGLAVDLNPTENPYIGCGQSRDPATRPYRDRSRHKRGMIGPRVVAAFRSIGWGWGGAWTGDTKDYMHFSVNGH
jgi:hypothetical protein